MPHSRARIRSEQRDAIKAEMDDDFFYSGQGCSCGKRLYIWAIPPDPKMAPVQLSGWIPIIPRSCYDHRIVTSHSFEDARRALAGKAVSHDTYMHFGDILAPHLAHGAPSGTALIASFCGSGMYGEGLRDVLLGKVFAKCHLVLSVTELREELWKLMPGDFFIGMLCELEPGGIFDEDGAVSFIEKLEDEWLPKGARAILETTTLLGGRIDETAELCLGRIKLPHAPSPEQICTVVAEMRSN